MNQDGPRVSVVIPTYNNARFVAEAVESVLQQTYRDYEIVVIDDGSTDTTRDVLAPFQDRIHYLHQENAGAGAARNRGIEESRGELIAFLDSDDLWYKTKLEKSVAAFDRDREAGLVYNRYLQRDLDSGRERRGHVFGRSGRVAAEYILFFRGVHTSSVVIRRECFEKCGRFDPSLQLSQDVDLWLRIMEDYPIREIPEVLHEYRSHGAGLVARMRDVWQEESLRLLDKAFERRPDLYQPLRSRIYSKAFCKYGLRAYNRLDFRQARQYFSRSLRLKVSKTALFYLLKTYLPAGIVARLRKYRQPEVSTFGDGNQ